VVDDKLHDEAGRILALRRYGIIDTGREDNFDAITSLVCSVLEVPMCAVTFIDEKRQWFKSSVGLGGTETERGLAFCDHTIRERGVMLVEDATLDPRFAENSLVTDDPHIRSYAGVPLVTPDGYQLGALCAIDRKPRSYNAAQVAILERFSGLVVEQLELRTLAHNDFLTGALTRRAISAAGAKAIRQHDRDKTSAALLALDLDHFKRINDTFGHHMGDKVLKAVADACTGTLRPGDLFGRLGGEEFAILLPSTAFFEAARCAERLRTKIEQIVMPSGSVTASFGLAMVDEHSDFDSWLAAADDALYQAKSGGRNRWVAKQTELRAA
jgi:diguanylate cyclase (GGDEF)-like protein